ncbi:SDR family NAD(P)-dependent oxidoreductase [Rhodococcus sp. NPDC127530]|uniref:SDR family NAD(P)-dependent oxidoreductase n=1 Tax=unclassified Rhodococcus (in: high G+C Gram-positive bacteria) TaxID=192944 RepID=UPI00362DEC62
MSSNVSPEHGVMRVSGPSSFPRKDQFMSDCRWTSAGQSERPPTTPEMADRVAGVPGGCAGKVVLVIGGTRGIGRATTLALAEAGGNVIVTGRSEAATEDVVSEAGRCGGCVTGRALDVRDPEASRSLVADVVSTFGCVDGVVANAGINPYFVRPEDLTPAMWDEIMDVNLRGIFFAVQAVAQQMLKQGFGSVVSISSVTARMGTERGMPYVASKGGLDSMTQTLAVDWASRGVRVNGVAPGYIETDLTSGLREHEQLSSSILKKTPMGRFGRAEEIAGMVEFLISDRSSYVTGQTFAIDGGMASAR